MLEGILLIILLIVLIGFLGGNVIIKHDNKETNLNDKINEAVDRVKETLSDNDKKDE